MYTLKMGGLIIAAYVAAGRPGSVATCLFLGISPWQTLLVSVVIDMIQVPAYGILIEMSQKHRILPGRFTRWLEHRFQHLQEQRETKGYWGKLANVQHLSVVAVATLPFRGCGILSACILAAMLRYNRIAGTILILSGSVIGALLTIVILFFPARWFSGL